MEREAIASILVVSVILIAFAAIIIYNFIQYKKSMKKLDDLKEKIDQEDRKRNEFREFIKTVFNPIVGLNEYLDGKVIILSVEDYFTYDKNNPKFKVSLRNNSPMGLYNVNNDIYYLACQTGEDEFVVVQDVRDSYTPEKEEK